MSIMNSVQRGYIPLVLIALIVSLQAVLAGKEVACDAHFWADEGPNPRISCVTLEYPTRDHKCKPHSCTGRSKQGRQSWEKFQFGPCHRPGHPKGHITPVKQYFRGRASVAVQDKAGDWWECNYFEDGEGNNGAIICTDCDVVLN
ncbi:hypothetical protein MJO28_006422 [Puccinia striiformis f. sp. tritici]|uniref:Uncharacterized protein n=1 Tax=Puccinia striiformis f. sp. tritici TaxID=168172 RepID=A0ACC0EHD9_9BASI|nr:hypothetical protein MJO28_006422 [Puccinia striiformis f. sp. tritici]KAI7958179.1 hypothetical protein MJO29_006396 [Puccinia striiformis f. sp. tritici]KAI9605187.1 hypothetical protein H4Q26_003164 [Puccinia striiformis f. sp. tritici PST-130]